MQGDVTGAETALRVAVRLRPESAVMQTNLGHVLARRYKLTEARQHFEAALRIGPSNEQARSAFLIAMAATGNPARAQESFHASLGSQRSDAENNLGTVCAALGDTAGALIPGARYDLPRIPRWPT